MKEKLFVYGTLKEPKLQIKVIGRKPESSPDVLIDYKKSKIKINNKIYPISIQKKNSSVSGLVISITTKELKIIDEYETNAYKRKKVVLESKRNVWVYLKNN